MDGQEFIKALDMISEEKGIDKEQIFEAIELALISAYKKNNDSKSNVRVEINKKTGNIKVFSFITVVEEVEDPEVEITVAEAHVKDADLKLGDTIETEITPKDFGRVATGTAKQVVMQKIREAERNSIMEEFNDKEEDLVTGIVSREDNNNYYVDLGRAHGLLPKIECIPGEKIVMGSHLKVYVTKIENGTKGPFILLSRTHYGFLKRLLELEIPELNDGTILLYSVAREAGHRSKIAVYSENEKVDPIGACVGEKGSRINNIIRELSGEKIDVILYDPDPIKFISNALSPAKNVDIKITDAKNGEAEASIDSDNLSLAIGKKGQNVRLAARLTHYRIDIKPKEGI